MNNTFDFNRFKMVIRWDILSNWKTYFRTMIGLAFGITLLALICLCTFRSRSLSSIDAENLFRCSFYQYSDSIHHQFLHICRKLLPKHENENKARELFDVACFQPREILRSITEHHGRRLASDPWRNHHCRLYPISIQLYPHTRATYFHHMELSNVHRKWICRS